MSQTGAAEPRTEAIAVVTDDRVTAAFHEGSHKDTVSGVTADTRTVSNQSILPVAAISPEHTETRVASTQTVAATLPEHVADDIGLTMSAVKRYQEEQDLPRDKGARLNRILHILSQYLLCATALPERAPDDDFGMVMLLLKKLQEKPDLHSHMSERLKSFIYVLDDHPSAWIIDLAKIMMSMEGTLDNMRNSFRGLEGDPNWYDGTVDLTTPSETMMASKWTKLRQQLNEAVGLSEDKVLPPGHLSAHLAQACESVIGVRFSDLNLPNWVGGLKLGRPGLHTAHWVMSVFLCTSVFSIREAVRDAESWRVANHILDLFEQSGGKSQLSNGTIVFPADGELEDGFEAANIGRRIGPKVQYEGKQYRNTEMKTEVAELSTTLQKRWEALYPGTEITPAMLGCAHVLHGLIDLRQELVLSIRDYKIIRFRPGTEYDPTWMEAEMAAWQPVVDQPTEDREVCMCLWPALVHHPNDPKKRKGATDNTFLHFMGKDSSFEGSDLVVIVMVM
jgi:hypothetical protein